MSFFQGIPTTADRIEKHTTTLRQDGSAHEIVAWLAGLNAGAVAARTGGSATPRSKSRMIDHLRI